MKFLWWSTVFLLIVFSFFLAILTFGHLPIPVSLIDGYVADSLPPTMVLSVRSASFGFRSGLKLESVRLRDSSRKDPLVPVVSVEDIVLHPFARQLILNNLEVPRLHDAYYEPGNLEKNAPVQMEFPDLGGFHLRLVGGNVLGVRPELVDADVDVKPRRIRFDDIRLVWPDSDVRMVLDGECAVDLVSQRVTGEVRGLARQAHIRPLLVALDLPVSLPYMDAFTEVPEPVPSRCAWKVNLVNNDLELDLDLKPVMGRYQDIPMKWAKGTLKICPSTRGKHLNYHTVVGPIVAEDCNGRLLSGTVDIRGVEGFNTVTIDATSALPIADLIKIAGFTGHYVDADARGDVKGHIQLRFPRAMTNNYEVLNGEGIFSTENGQLKQIQLFAGLTQLMAEKVPGVRDVVDQTRSSGTFRIENGVVKTEDTVLEGKVFSIRMNGKYDAPRNKLDFSVLVTLFRNDSFMSKLMTPITWPFSKLLMEFRLTGSPEDPKWEYVSMLDRILEVVK